MAFIKTANAKVQRHSLNVEDWNAIRKGSLKGKVRVSSDNNTISEYSPDKYLLTHCTIIASVDVDEKGPKNDKGWYYYITPETEKFVNSNQDAWQRDLLLATYHTFKGAFNYVEHIQIEELSKGKIIDAVARDIGDSVYIDILVATDRKHTELVADIENGDITTLSMGCSCTFTLCTKCGNIAHDETDMCECIKYSKGNNFFDSKGKRRIIAELCGHSSDPESVIFIEASWVANPAFKGAVMRNILTAADVTENQIKEAYAINRIIDPVALQKAASRNKSSSFSKIGDFNFDEDPSLGDDGSAAPAPKEEKEPIKELTDEMKNLIRNRVKKELREELQDFKDPNKDLSENNENMIRSNFAFTSFKNRYASYGNDLALYRLYEGLVSVKTSGWKSLKYKGYTGREILALSHFIDAERGGDSLDKKYYSAIARLGGTDPYKNPLEYLSKIGKETGVKKMSVKLAKQLIYKGNLYNCGV